MNVCPTATFRMPGGGAKWHLRLGPSGAISNRRPNPAPIPTNRRQPGIYDIAPAPFPFPLGAMIAGRALSLQWPDATKVRTARTARLKLRVLEDILQSCHEIVDSRLARRSESAMKPRRAI
jgi:hypothetical protein